MSLGLQNSTNLAIQLQNIYSQELPLLAQLGENWNLYSLGPGMFRAIRVLTNAQVIRLPNVPVEIVPSPGPRKILYPNGLHVRMGWVADYASIDANAVVGLLLGVDTVMAQWNEGVGGSVTALLAGGGPDGTNGFGVLAGDVISDSFIGNLAGRYDSDIANKAFFFTATNGASVDFTGGNAGNSLTVTVDYSVISF